GFRVKRLVLNGRGPRFAHSFSRNGRLAVIDGEHEVVVWDVAGSNGQRVIESYLGRMGAVALSADGRSVAVCFDTARYVIRIWDVKSGAELVTLEAALVKFQEAAFSPDGRTLATMQTGGRLTIWDVAKKKALVETWSDRRDVAALRFSPDGKKLAVA